MRAMHDEDTSGFNPADLTVPLQAVTACDSEPWPGPEAASNSITWCPHLTHLQHQKAPPIYQILTDPVGGNRTPKGCVQMATCWFPGRVRHGGRTSPAALEVRCCPLRNNLQVENAIFSQDAPFPVFSILKPDFQTLSLRSGHSTPCKSPVRRKWQLSLRPGSQQEGAGGPSLHPAGTRHPQGLSTRFAESGLCLSSCHPISSR